LLAAIRLHPGSSVTEDDIRAFCQGKLAHYKVPRYVRFVEAYPMTVSGKVQKYKIRDEAIEVLGL
jgi:fatty-acyl-CoA synthase